MEATAISVGKAVLGGALSYAKSKASEEVALQLGVEDDVVFITDELQMMQSFLMTADEERDRSKVLTTWVTQIRDLAYNVEDSLMDFGLHAGKKPIWGCIPRKLSDRRRIAKEVKKLRAKVEDVSNRKLSYRLIKDGSKPATAAEQAAAAGAAMFGINQAMLATVEQEKPKADLLQLITSKEVDLRVMAVWGTTGDSGKTSVIHEVYGDPIVTSSFGFRAWVRLMHPFNPKEFLYGLVRQFYENSLDKHGEGREVNNVGADVLLKMEEMHQTDLVRSFSAHLSSNSYLIVIDDLSTIQEWHCIRRYFPDNKKQSRIIVSTQQVEIASLCTEQPYQMSELKQLSYDQTLYVFHMKNSEERTNIASASKCYSDDARPANLEQEKSNVDLSQLINNENINNTTQETSQPSNKTTVIPSSVSKPICDLSTSSGEIHEEYQQRESTGGNKFSTSTAENNNNRTRTIALVDEVVGRKTEKSKVIELIGQPNDKQGCKVISVWGMGGIGKTTLVRSIYRGQQLSGWKRAWVTALRPFDPEVLFRTLILQLATKQQRKKIEAMKLDEITSNLSQLLENHECLIVIDDLLYTEEWNFIRHQLSKAARIIVTTRENRVAQYCSVKSKNMYSLQVLQHEEAFDLFVKKVFKDHAERCHLGPDMMDQATLILKKCDGLPLAISTIGGFLATKPKTAIEWRKINDHISAELEINPELRTIKTVLMRSYDGLPYYLKSCFLYMSIFPEDYKIKRKRLIRRWIAESYCREMHGMTAEEVGDKYFDDLLGRSMILPSEGEIQYRGKIDSCQLHDLIREICISKSREENLVFTLEEGCSLSSAQGPIRHLVIGSNWKRDKEVLESILDLSHVRSLTVFGDWKSFFISDKMRFLRVLDLGDTLGLKDHHLDQIGQFLHLRYLSLRGCRNIFSLPSSVGNLIHLQTLDGRGTCIARFPSAVTKLRKLQQLLVSAGSAGRQQGEVENSVINQMNKHYDFFISNAGHLLLDMENHLSDGPRESYDSIERIVQDAFVWWHTEVSDGGSPRAGTVPIRKNNWRSSLLYHSRVCLTHNLFRLLVCIFCWKQQVLANGFNRRDLSNIPSTFFQFFLGGVEAPRGIRKLKALHTLGVVDVARSKTALKELEELTQLRKLGVAGVHGKYSKKFWSSISGHNQLRSLSVRGLGLDACLGGDFLPPKHLESLRLRGKLVRVTDWIHRLQNLSKLVLSRTKLDSPVPVKAIGDLPNLAVLRLWYESFVGELLLFQGPSFPSLMVLDLQDFKNYLQVVFEKDAMPKLELIQIDGSSVAEMSGLAFLASLNEIRLGSGAHRIMKENLQRQLTEDLKDVSLKLL